MSFLLIGTSLAKPFLLLTFACSNASMQDCEVFQDRFETSEECWHEAERLDLMAESIPLKFRALKHTYTVTNCSEVPLEQAPDIYPSTQMKPLGF